MKFIYSIRIYYGHYSEQMHMNLTINYSFAGYKTTKYLDPHILVSTNLRLKEL